ncbi:MAG: DUF2946 domain-containing protein [Shimia sp.]|uniref:DUF2946 domain-containing protein n=1 Tax=Shimia sp. TaxID=1954381 RepID=UPI003B8B7931
MRFVTSLVLLVAVLLSASIPMGWMPKTLSDGHMVLVICTGDEFVEMLVDDTGAPVPYHQQTGDERSPCAFSVIAEAVQVLNGPFPMVLPASLTARWQHQDFTHNSAGFHRRYDARGPPTLS